MNSIIKNDIKEIVQNSQIDWNLFSNKTILITGANGMLPSYMVYTLMHLNKAKKIGVFVIAQVRNKEKGESIFLDYLNDPHFQLLVQDVTISYTVERKIDYIVHAASQASPKYYSTDPVGTILANVEGTINVLNLARRNDCESVLFFSSAEVYGQAKCKYIKEDRYGYLDPTSPRSCYAESKRMGEQLCYAWNTQYRTHCKSVRPFHTFGPNMTLDDGRVFADFVKNIVNKENIILKSSGEAKRAFCYVTDATIAFFMILLYGKDGISYNMGNPKQEISIRDLATKLVGLFPERNLKVIYDINENDTIQKTAVKSTLPDIGKLKNLGWKPLISVEDGFSRVIKSKIELL